jgi:hypothetical protein
MPPLLERSINRYRGANEEIFARGALEIIRSAIHDPNESIRYWAVESLAFLGSDAQTRSWVFQALRDITGQTLPPDPSRWRLWYQKAK